ncbi:UDP-3-O-(3-hydroxymyristoyl)glucosamine N-acyltransferase [Desulfamplus magnetovallimortis]|nr:UDP-3-O-(3-hydroxymyristoyl)glucosamine N-acyltransferase [Desulfamplus magnetovallimortis]
MKLSLKDIALAIDGEIIGDSSLEIHGVASFEDAGPGEITFASDSKFLKRLHSSRAGAVVVPPDLDFPYIGANTKREECNLSSHNDQQHENYQQKNHQQESSQHKKNQQEYYQNEDTYGGNGESENHNDSASIVYPAIVKAENPKRQFFRIVAMFHPPLKPSESIASGVVIGKDFVAGKQLTLESRVTVCDGVTLGHRVHIMSGAYIGDNVVMGDDVVIKPNVTIMGNTKIGSRVVIHPGTVIGSDGFGFTPDLERGHEKIPHAGYVEIGDDVEIGACNTIDRGTFGKTLISKGVKTDNLVHIAHNVTIGENSLIVAQVGIAGSTTIGNRVIIAGKAGISGHLKIGDGAIVGPGAGVLGDVKPGEIVSGIPEMPHKIWLKVAKILPRLPELRKKILAIEKKLSILER